ncbi:MAG: hypothetical protein JW757_05715 [Anaerolineales bacterium]|nr:hypothetical protein [Anaerolineales bacterium]
MKPDSQSTQVKLIILFIVLYIFSACSLSGRGGDEVNQNNTGNNTGDNAVNPAPPVLKPEADEPIPSPTPQPTDTPEPTTPPDPVEEPGPAVPDEPLNTSRLLPALKDIMLRPDDLVVEYVMQNDREVDNTRMITQITWGDGREYNAVTTRITGWNTYMERAKNDYAPFSFRTRLEIFETIEGAKTAFSSDWLFIFNDPNLKITEFLSTECEFGHDCVLAYYEENVPGTTDFNVEYHLVFRYRNVGLYVFSKGLEGTVTEETVYEIAQLMLDRLATYE